MSTTTNNQSNEVKRSNSMGSSQPNSSTSFLDQSRMNKAQQKYSSSSKKTHGSSNKQPIQSEPIRAVQQQQQYQQPPEEHYLQQQYNQPPLEQHYQQQTILKRTTEQHQQNHPRQSTNRVGVSVNNKRHVQEQQQQPRRKTTHQILAEAQKQSTVSFDNSGLNIINGSHVKQQQQQQQVTTMKSTAFTRLSRPPQEQRKPPPKPQRVNKPMPQQDDIYQSIKVSTKGGVITLFSDREHQKTMEATEEFKSHIASSMYYSEHQQKQQDYSYTQQSANQMANSSTISIANQQKRRFQGFEEDDAHESCFVQGTNEQDQSCCHSDSIGNNGALITLKPGEETETVYYTVCTHFFHPEKNDWIQKIHRTGSVLVPKDRPHHQKCVFWNHLYDPDKEEIIVHKLIESRDNNKQQQQQQIKYQEEISQHQHARYPLVELEPSRLQPPQRRQQRPMKFHEDNLSHDQMQRSPLVEQRSGGFNSRHNRSWVEQAFNDDFDDTYSERGARQTTTTSDLDTTNYSTSTFDDSNLLDTGFDARSVDSQSISSGKSGHFPSQYHSQHREQYRGY